MWNAGPDSKDPNWVAFNMGEVPDVQHSLSTHIPTPIHNP